MDESQLWTLQSDPRKLMHNQMKKPYETRDLVYLIQAEPI
jgi:hypothetical protein